MRHGLIYLMFFCLLCAGCQKALAVYTITEDYEILQEADFEFQYPADWKVVSEGDHTNPKQQTTTYKFHHPNNKDFFVAIELFKFIDSTLDSDTQVRKILSSTVRTLKKQYDKDRYKQFTFKAFETKFAGYKATKLIVNGSKDDIKRETVSIVLPNVSDFYVVYYQWFSSWDKTWGKKAKRKIKKIVNSFQLTL